MGGVAFAIIDLRFWSNAPSFELFPSGRHPTWPFEHLIALNFLRMLLRGDASVVWAEA